MKVKASITIDEESLRALDSYAGNDNSRSALFQEAVDEWLARRQRKQRDERDRRIFAEQHVEMNRELEDILEYQADPFEPQDTTPLRVTK